MSSDSSVNDALAGYAAGQLSAEQLVGVVAAAYYGEQGARSREQLKPLMDIVERAHPGIVVLAGIDERPGFAVKLAERTFPIHYESELRLAARALLENGVVSAPRSLLPAPSLFTRIIRAIRRAFSA